MVVNSMSYATYDSYKDSGVDWLGEIPSDWDLIPNKHIFKLKNIKVGKKSSEYDLLSLTLKGVIKRDMENPEGKFPAEFDTYQEVKNGNFIFCMFDVQETPRTVGLSKFDGMITGAYTVFDVNENYNRDFLYYFYLNLDLDKRLKPLYRGLRNTIPKEWFLNFKTFVPSFKQQKAIANFLDDKTVQIDQAIALKQQQIEKLNEYKQIVIQNAVTKGLNPNVPMKNSGVEWIGDIPEHWEVKKLKNVSKVVLGKMICNEKTGNMKLKPYLKSKNIQWLKVDLNSVDEMWFTPKEMEMYRLKQGDLVLSEGGEVGKTCIWNNDLEECYIQNSAHKVTFENKQNSKYYLYLFFSLGKQGQFEKIVNRVSIGHLTKEKLINTFVFCPPLSEQNEIVKLIDDYLIKFNEIINCYETQIDRLKEYKNILINQAVTGKIKI